MADPAQVSPSTLLDQLVMLDPPQGPERRDHRCKPGL
jgi:hypothetical protein